MKLPRRDTMALLADALALPAAEQAVFGAAARPPMHRTAVPGAPPDDPKHVAAPWVYVAHAQTDDAVVERLHTDLEQYGITVGVDEHGLPPGTPDWEQALREAIRASMALLLLASPRTRTSRYVADELRIAELYGRRVFPIWIEGDQWMECVPLGWGGLQYLDARAERYTPAIAALAAAMQRVQAPRAHAAEPAGPPSIPTAEPRNPYKGLRAFTREDASDFFGRDTVVEAMLGAIGTAASTSPRFLTLVGASGSGKSSMMLAGLLPRLQAGALPGSAEWVYLEPFMPGARPLDALALSLSLALGSAPAPIRDELEESSDALHRLAHRRANGAGQRVVVVVDQGEEIFASAIEEGERRLVIDLLVTAATAVTGPVLVLMTLRADFYDRPLRYPALGALLHEHSMVIQRQGTDLVQEFP